MYTHLHTCIHVLWPHVSHHRSLIGSDGRALVVQTQKTTTAAAPAAAALTNQFFIHLFLFVFFVALIKSKIHTVSKEDWNWRHDCYFCISFSINEDFIYFDTCSSRCHSCFTTRTRSLSITVTHSFNHTVYPPAISKTLPCIDVIVVFRGIL